MFAVEIVGMCSGNNMPKFDSYDGAELCFQDAVDFCLKFRHNSTIRILDLLSGCVLFEVVVNHADLPF